MTPFVPNTEGVFLGLPAAEYHAAPGVSNSTLKRFMEAATPRHFKLAPPREPSAEMEFGTVAHTAILETDKFAGVFYKRPDTYPSTRGEKPWHGGAEWCREWLSQHRDLPILTSHQAAKIPRIQSAVRACTQFADALESRGAATEVSFFKRDPWTGLLLKCRADLCALDSQGFTWLFDPKSVQPGGATDEAFTDQALKLGYHCQAASYLYITGASRFVFVAFETDEPFDACQWEPDENMLKLGFHEWRAALDRYALCVQDDNWPGYQPGINKMTLPRWAQKKLGL